MKSWSVRIIVVVALALVATFASAQNAGVCVTSLRANPYSRNGPNGCHQEGTSWVAWKMPNSL